MKYIAFGLFELESNFALEYLNSIYRKMYLVLRRSKKELKCPTEAYFFMP